MARLSGAWSLLLKLTLFLYLAYIGGWAGFRLAEVNEAFLVWSVVFTVAGATLLGLVSISFPVAALIDHEDQRRVFTLALWGTTVVFLSVGAFVEFRFTGTAYRYSGLLVLFNLICGAMIGIWLGEGRAKKVNGCPGQ